MVSEYQVGRAKKSDGIWEREWSGAHEKVSSEFAIKSLSIPNSLHIHFCLDKKHEIHSSFQNFLFICVFIYIS